jgi:hypothetical protein
MGKGQLRSIVGYGRKVYDLGERLACVRDGREEPATTAEQVAAAVFFGGLLRIRSFNALEPKLRERTFLRLVGAPESRKTLCSADTLSRALREMVLGSVRAITVGMLRQAERNKVFREGWVGTMRYVAIDGWEPICSYKRHCKNCLVRLVEVRRRDGTVEQVEQYYHRYVVAMLINERLDLAVDIEPLLPSDLRPDGGREDDEDEGELTAAKRLLRRVKNMYSWVDVVIADGLYPNGPFLTLVSELRMGAVIIIRKEGNEPLREALAIWGDAPAEQTFVDDSRSSGDRKTRERIELWDCSGIETLTSYNGPIRVVRGRVSDLRKPEEPPHTWCMVVIGKAMKLTATQVVRVGRGRWHIENTGFNQWTQHWKFCHVFVHDGNGILALYWLFFAAYNLLTLFLYMQLRSYGRDRGRDVTRTISRLVDEMRDDLARLTRSPWDTS